MLNLYASSPEGQIFVGVAGWNHPEWRALLGLNGARGELACLATLCNLVEVHSTYYHPPDVKTVKAWLDEIGEAKSFCFTVRLWNKLVRERALLLQNDIRLMKAALTPLQEAGKLGAVLVQAVPSMRYSQGNESWLLGLLDLFAEFPLFVENLHASWAKSDTLLRLQDRGVGIAAREELGEKNPAALPMLSGERAAYLRCGVQNANAGLGPHAKRSDYLYSPAAIANLARKLKTMSSQLSRGFVVFTNHAHGCSLANAAQLRHALSGEFLDLPRNLIQAFPALQAPTSASAKQCDLFEERV